MGWLAPLFLAVGAAAIAIPVLVHLIHRERNETVSFPSLMFLQRIPYRSMRRQKIRHWLLFVLRCVALILLAAAFARPFFDRDDRISAAGTGGRELVILLDQSYSMGYGDRWQRAVTAARRAVDGLTADDRATVVLFAQEAHATGRSTADRASLTTAIDTAKVSSQGTRYGPALKAARSILEDSRLPRREVLLITDFQKLGWTPDDAARLPEGTTLTRVDLSGGVATNVAVTGLSFQRDYPEGRERVLVAARVINQGDQPVRRHAVTIELNGRELQSRTVDLAANSAASVTFTPFMLPEGSSRGTVRTATDALPADNAFHFELTQGQAVSLLVVEPNGATDRSLFLRRALSVGDRPVFRADVKRVSQVTRAELAGRSLVVLDDTGIPNAEMARLLADFVSGGGGLIVSLGDRSSLGSFATESRSWLPALVGNVVDRASGKLTRIDYTHPVFELFSAPRSGDFSGAQFFRYRKLDVRSEDEGKPDGQAVGRANAQRTAGAPAVQPSSRPAVQVLASFDDGSPALVEGKHGKGTVMVWASTLDSYWGNLAVQPIFLPFIHQLARHTAGYTEASPWFTVGQSVDVADGRTVGASDGQTDPRTELIAEAPSGARTVLPAGTGSRVLNLFEQGFYEVRRPGETAPRRVIASNLDLAESDLTSMDPAEFAAAVEYEGGPGTGPGGEMIPLAPEERERPQSIWWYLLVAAFVILAAETVVGNQLSRGAAT